MSKAEVKVEAKAATSKTRTTKPRPPGEFIEATELAGHMQISTHHLSNWIRDEKIPPPWVRPSTRKRLWRRSHFNEFVESGRWPAKAWKDTRTG